VNVQKGLERVSAVWWGFWGLLAFAMFVVGLFSDGFDSGVLIGGGFAGLVACGIAHKLTCWVVAGFFAPRP